MSFSLVLRGFLYQEYDLRFANFEKNRYICNDQEHTNHEFSEKRSILITELII